MAVTLEHANLMVSSIEDAVRFLTTAFPEFQIRGRGVYQGRPWVHIGTDDTYIAMTEVDDLGQLGAPLNHLGYVVEDIDSLADRLLAAGFREGFISPPHPYRKRRYFHDADDLEWEFVEYLSDDPAKRNDYSQ